MTISPPAEVLGVQRPRLIHLPDGIVSTSGPEYVELAASAGLHLDSAQQFHINVARAERADGKWAAVEFAEVESRQNGKGSEIEALELGDLYLLRLPLVIHTSHEFKTSSEAFLRVKSLIDNTDDLRRKVAKVWTAHGSEGIQLLPRYGGGRLRFIARSGGSGRGFSAPSLFLDEAYKLTAETMAALLPTLSAQANPWIGYFSSAGKSDSTQLHSLRRRALSGKAARLAYLEHSVNPDEYGGRGSEGWAKARRDPKVWAIANPALGTRITVEIVQTELETLPTEIFDRERLGLFDPEPSVDEPLFSLAEWDGCADPKSEFVGKVAFAVDVSPGAEWTSISVVGIRADGLPHVELVERRRGVDWFAGRRKELDAKHRPKLWVRDPSGPAVELAGKFTDLKPRDATEASARLLTAVADRKFRWVCDESLQPALLAAVIGAARKDQGDGNWKWSRLSSGVDISPLVSMTWALWAGPIVARSKPIALFA